MDYFKDKINYFFRENITKDTVNRFILFLIPLVSIVLKGIIFQGFLTNENPYSFNFNSGYTSAQSFINYYIAFVLIFLSFSLLFKGKGRIIYIFIIDILLTTLIMLDLCYFRGFLTVPSILIATQTANLDNLSGAIYSMFSSMDFLFILDFIVLGIYIYFTRNSYKNIKRRSFKTFLFTFIIPILFIGYVPFNIHILNNTKVKDAYLFDNYDPTNTARYFSPIGYHIFDLYTVYRDSKPYKLTKEDKSNIEEFFEIKKENLPDNNYFGTSKNKNLIYIQVESLEDFVIGRTINGQEITPVLNKLTSNSFYFPNVFEQVNEGTSSDSDLMVNTSLFPLRRGSTFFRYPNTNYNSLPNILEEENYSTIAIHPDKGSFWNYASGLTGIGFDKFNDSHALNIDEAIGMGISDKRYFEQVVPMLKQQSQPFYALTVTLTSHGPFDLPKEYRELNLNTELDKSELGGYFESIHYTDKQIGHFIDLLDKEGMLDNTVIAIMGDHTGVHKYYNNSVEQLSNKEDWFLNTGNPTVPLVIYDSSIKEGKTFDVYGGQIDVMPTLLYMLGVDKSKYEDTAFGRNLLNTQKSFAVLTNGTIKGGENLTDKEKEIYKKSLDLSDKMIRANYAHN
ncbi:LTA synthase family protein [Clostridium uliginosum]|uniref:Phosphoglycerol transferase MdoB n=1 Tax=Clostridium uliginosum TaxID=119641 RepID=A0A1I1IDT3_9CLOT|nr:LTA synthase family protein [Clostridium uliginosum]SFC34285.1 Phosphoglycerol transferase MdoB [Clostridium uliginosum]